MNSEGSDRRAAAWRVFGILAAVALYTASISGPFYDLTTPVTMVNHELLRKIYAVLAFALLGFALECSRLRHMRGVLAAGVALAVYSYAIELGQIFIDHAKETFAQHAFDVASGLVGGALGALAALLITAPHERARRTEAVAVVAGLAVLVWGYTVTYGQMR
jgi:VanZ family protein